MSMMMAEKRYRLAPYVNASWRDDGELILGFGSIQQRIETRSLARVIVDLADHLAEPRTAADVRAFVAARVPDGVDGDRAGDALFERLHEGRFLIEEGEYDRDERYSRHGLFFQLCGGQATEVQRRLASKRVVVAGCGGIGNLVATTLVTAGVGELLLFDGDRVELSNLTRQYLYQESDVGRAKVEVLRERLVARNASAKVDTLGKRVGAEAFAEVGACDLVVLSADYPRSLIRDVNAWSLRTQTPFIAAGYVQDVAVWGPLYIPGQTACAECLPSVRNATSPDTDETLRRVNARYQAPSMGPVNMLASSCVALDALKFLAGVGTVQALGRRVAVWTHDLRIDTHPAPRAGACAACQHVLPRDQPDGEICA